MMLPQQKHLLQWNDRLVCGPLPAEHALEKSLLIINLKLDGFVVFTAVSPRLGCEISAPDNNTVDIWLLSTSHAHSMNVPATLEILTNSQQWQYQRAAGIIAPTGCCN